MPFGVKNAPAVFAEENLQNSTPTYTQDTRVEHSQARPSPTAMGKETPISYSREGRQTVEDSLQNRKARGKPACCPHSPYP